MRRLVDIDEVIRIAKDTFPKEDVRKIAWVLCYTPTAYDVEKVVAELEEVKNRYCFMGYQMAIDIVKRGGVE